MAISRTVSVSRARGVSRIRLHANLVQWLSGDSGTYQDSALTTPATADAAVIGGWVDRCASGFNATMVTALNKPILKTGANGLNNLPIVRFDGVQTFLTMSGPSLLSVPWSCVAVIRVNGGTGYQCAYSARSAFLYGRFNGRDNWGSFVTGAELYSGVSVSSAWKIVGIISRNYNDYDLYTNGVRVNRTTGSSYLASAGYAIGTASTQWFNGDIAEIKVFNAAITPAQMISLTEDLNAKLAVY